MKPGDLVRISPDPVIGVHHGILGIILSRRATKWDEASLFYTVLAHGGEVREILHTERRGMGWEVIREAR